MGTGTINAIATAHETAYESSQDELLCNKSLFALLREYMRLKIPEMACSALTHGCAVLPSPLLQSKNTRKFDRRNEQRYKRFRRHWMETKWTNAAHGIFLYPHPGCSCREHKTTEYQLRGKRALGPGKDMTRDCNAMPKTWGQNLIRSFLLSTNDKEPYHGARSTD